MVSETLDASLLDAGRFLKAPGGAPANVAVGLSRLGTSSRFIGQVGADPFGDWLREVLQGERVNVDYLSRSATARTSMAFIATWSDGCKDICFYRNPGADGLIAPEDIRLGMFSGARLFHCGSVSLAQSPSREAQFVAAAHARAQGLLVSFDPNWRPTLWPDHGEARRIIWEMMRYADIVKVADEEWEFITGEQDLETGAAKIRAMGPKLVVVTLGSQGAYYDCATARGQVAAVPVHAVDTLGAGDAFTAGLLYQILSAPILDDLLSREKLEAVVRFANICGAITTQKTGAIPALPRIEQILAFQRE